MVGGGRGEDTGKGACGLASAARLGEMMGGAATETDICAWLTDGNSQCAHLRGKRVPLAGHPAHRSLVPPFPHCARSNREKHPARKFRSGRQAHHDRVRPVRPPMAGVRELALISERSLYPPSSFL